MHKVESTLKIVFYKYDQKTVCSNEQTVWFIHRDVSFVVNCDIVNNFAYTFCFKIIYAN